MLWLGSIAAPAVRPKNHLAKVKPSPLLSRLLAFALALVLPIQGVAALAAYQCMALEHHEGLVTQMSHDTGTDHGAGSGHEAHVHSDDGASVETGSNASVSGGPSGDSGSGHCGPCAACCTSATIPGAIAVVAVTPVSSAPYRYVPAAPAPVFLAALDRPPLPL